MELAIRDLSKTYANGVRALDEVTLDIPRGMFGLLGPNGAGKSTLMRVLATLQEPDRGEARLGAIDMLRDKDAVRRLLGYLPQDFGVYPKVTAYEMLDHLALLKGIVDARQRKEEVDALLERVNLFDHRKKALTGFSGGMRQRFGIAQALLGNPQLIIVDEPTAGLDPGERNRFHNLLAEIGENMVVILSTHIVDDVTELCTNMAIIHLGRVLYTGPPQKAIEELAGRVWQRTVAKTDLAEYEQRYRVVSSKLIAGKPLIHVVSDEAPGEGFTRVEADLEDVFFTAILGAGGSRAAAEA